MPWIESIASLLARTERVTLLTVKSSVIEVQGYVRYRNGERELVSGHDRGNGSAGTKAKTRCISYTGEEGRTKAQEALARLRAKGFEV